MFPSLKSTVCREHTRLVTYPAWTTTFSYLIVVLLRYNCSIRIHIFLNSIGGSCHSWCITHCFLVIPVSNSASPSFFSLTQSFLPPLIRPALGAADRITASQARSGADLSAPLPPDEGTSGGGNESVSSNPYNHIVTRVVLVVLLVILVCRSSGGNQ